MSAPQATIAPTVHRLPHAERGTVLLTATAALTFAVTGIGMFEGHVIYPSWLDLAAFPDFAGYHTEFGRALLPWLPGPLVVVTLLNAVQLRRRPQAVPRALLVATLVGQIAIAGLTAAVFLPIQADLGTAGHSPDEIRALVQRLIDLSYLRDTPGLAIAAAYGWMLHRVLRHSAADDA